MLAELSAILSPTEMARAAKFHFDRHRHRFIAGRARLRQTLARYLPADPGRLEFAYSPAGKPGLGGEFKNTGIHFNTAHSEDLVAFAVTRIGPVGIDVEQIRRVKDMDDLVARFFSRRENEDFRKLAPAVKPVAFFNLWTRKEALLKATGTGIAGGLNQVEVSFRPDEPPRLIALAGQPGKAGQWTLQHVSPAPGFAGAVAVQGSCSRFRCWQCAAGPMLNGP